QVYAIIVAADLLCYFGELDALFAAVSAHLAPNGLFVATAELLQPPGGMPLPACGWQLARTGRYAHARRYVGEVAEAAGLEVRSIAEEALRLAAELPVPGLLGVFAKPAHAD